MNYQPSVLVTPGQPVNPTVRQYVVTTTDQPLNIQQILPQQPERFNTDNPPKYTTEKKQICILCRCRNGIESRKANYRSLLNMYLISYIYFCAIFVLLNMIYSPTFLLVLIYYSNILFGNRCLMNIHLILFLSHVVSIICVFCHHDMFYQY